MQLRDGYILYLLLLLTVAVTIGAKSKRIISNGRRMHRHVPQYPLRKERTRLDCRTHEHFVRCGPEPHCEMSCDNLYSPPHCYHVEDHPKCYYPRCVCNKGFVRDREGFCIREWKCPERYFEYRSYDDDGADGDDGDDDDDNGNDENDIKYELKKRPRQPKRHFW